MEIRKRTPLEEGVFLFFRGLVHFSFALLSIHMVQIISFLKKNGC